MTKKEKACQNRWYSNIISGFHKNETGEVIKINQKMARS
jgi:hypothetical protein